ncbi:MAG TPA: J domain-containing protein [Pyrinomonadaceae bacterium]
MSDGLGKYYELLGVAPGVSGRELRQAYHDLAKVWHPDRFPHDPRLQQKAQEKLKEINEAYEQLSSDSAGRPTRASSRPSRPDAPPHTPARRKRHRLILPAAALVFCIALLAALGTLLPAGAGRLHEQTAPDAQAEARPSNEERRPDGEARPAPTRPARSFPRAGRQTPSEATSADAPAPETDATQLRPMPTVTVAIDAVTGQLATRDCPTVSRMTYPAGAEPRQHCTTPHRTKVAARADSKGSRLKAIGKRLVEPFK